MFLGSFLVAIPNAKETITETNRLEFLFLKDSTFERRWIEILQNRTEVCLVCLSESEGKISLEGNKMNIQKDAFLTRVA